MRDVCLVALFVLVAGGSAFAQEQTGAPAAQAVSVMGAPRVSLDDPTGGAFTSPTQLFTPAASVPAWNVRVTTNLSLQGPTAPDRLASADGSIGVQPGIGAELGLPGGFTVGAGTQWVGGDSSPGPGQPTPAFGQGISPYLQVRYNILGDNKTGQGFLLG